VDPSERGDRGWKQAQRQGNFTDNFTVNIKTPQRRLEFVLFLEWNVIHLVNITRV
jgi:hypothetical protein